MPWPGMPADVGVPAGPGREARRPLAGVIFDMDGVIVDSEPLSMSTITELAAERGHARGERERREPPVRRRPQRLPLRRCPRPRCAWIGPRAVARTL